MQEPCSEESRGTSHFGKAAAAYLLKPIRQSELREALARVLGAQPQEGAIPLITLFSLHEARDPAAYLRVLLAEDNAVNQRLATRLLEKRGHRVAVACNGRSAGRAGKGEELDEILKDYLARRSMSVKQRRRL